MHVFEHTCMCKCVYAHVKVGESRGDSLLYHMGSKDWSWVIRFVASTLNQQAISSYPNFDFLLRVYVSLFSLHINSSFKWLWRPSSILFVAFQNLLATCPSSNNEKNVTQKIWPCQFLVVNAELGSQGRLIDMHSSICTLEHLLSYPVNSGKGCGLWILV